MAVKVKNTKPVNPAEIWEKLKKEKNQKNDLQKVPLMCQFLPGFLRNSPSHCEGGDRGTRGGSGCAFAAPAMPVQLPPRHAVTHPFLDKKGMELPAGQDLVSLGLDPGLRRDDDAQAKMKRYRVKPGMTTNNTG